VRQSGNRFADPRWIRACVNMRKPGNPTQGRVLL
jgi:hypothetical protein